VKVALLAFALALALGSGACSDSRTGWILEWSDEFNGPTLDSTTWVPDTGGAGWGNAELEYYTARPENARVENGNLIIEARQEQYGNSAYTSARLKTQGLRAWTYGRIEARIQIPRGQGLWPAFWMLGENYGPVAWPDCGEIDVMENIGKEPSLVHSNVHGPGYTNVPSLSAAYGLPAGAFADDFHVYAVEWEPGVIRWYVDDSLYRTLTPDDVPGPWAFDHPFFIILNVAVGGDWPGAPDTTTVFPQTMRVDYVRVYGRAGM
jgi:beta-glucanase (GH16 family)